MVRYIIRRLLGAFLLLLVVSAITYFVFFALPTSPGDLTCGKNCTPARVAAINASLGLNRPVPLQYVSFLQHFFTGTSVGGSGLGAAITCPFPCLGVSFRQYTPVSTLLAQYFPATVSITLGAGVLFLIVGVGVGVIAAVRRGKIADKGLMGLSLLFYSVPLYVLGLILQLVFIYKLGWLPSPGYASPIGVGVVPWLQGMVLPWISLMLLYAAGYSRYMRGSMLETMQEDFVRTARAKGLPRFTVIMRQALRGAITPIVTLFGLDLGSLLGGAVITESIFNIQGIGLLSIRGISNVDLPVIVGTVLLAAAFIILANVIVDVLYAVIDPRVRLT